MNHWRVTYATEPSTVTDNWHRISRRSGTLGLYYTSISSISIDSNHSLTQSVHMCTIYELVVWGTVIHPTLGDNLLKYVFFFNLFSILVRTVVVVVIRCSHRLCYSNITKRNSSIGVMTRTMPTVHHAVDEIEMTITPTPIRSQVMPKARTWNGFYKLDDLHSFTRAGIQFAFSRPRQTDRHRHTHTHTYLVELFSFLWELLKPRTYTHMTYYIRRYGCVLYPTAYTLIKNIFTEFSEAKRQPVNKTKIEFGRIGPDNNLPLHEK